MRQLVLRPAARYRASPFSSGLVLALPSAIVRRYGLANGVPCIRLGSRRLALALWGWVPVRALFRPGRLVPALVPAGRRADPASATSRVV